MTGRNLSVVQSAGLQLLVRMDNVHASEAKVDDIGLALVAANARSVQEAFPEYFPEPETNRVSTDEDLPEAALDEIGVRFDYSETDLEEDDMVAAAREIEMLSSAMGEERWQTVSGEGWV